MITKEETMMKFPLKIVVQCSLNASIIEERSLFICAQVESFTISYVYVNDVIIVGNDFPKIQEY